MTASLEEKTKPVAASGVRRRVVWDGLVAFLAAVQFLTVFPPLVRRPLTAEELGRSVGWFPLVGALIGGDPGRLDWLLGLLFRPGVSAALVLVCWVLSTGALHVDGFLDSCDGLFGGQTPEARLRIMRDERAGAFAVVGGVLLLLLKYATLSECPGRMQALLVAPVVGRWGMAFAVFAFPYGRAEGLGKAMKDHAGWPQLAAGSAAWRRWSSSRARPAAGAGCWVCCWRRRRRGPAPAS